MNDGRYSDQDKRDLEQAGPFDGLPRRRSIGEDVCAGRMFDLALGTLQQLVDAVEHIGDWEADGRIGRVLSDANHILRAAAESGSEL